MIFKRADVGEINRRFILNHSSKLTDRRKREVGGKHHDPPAGRPARRHGIIVAQVAASVLRTPVEIGVMHGGGTAFEHGIHPWSLLVLRREGSVKLFQTYP